MKTTKILICAVALAAAFSAIKANGQTLSAKLINNSPGMAVTGTISDEAVLNSYPAGVLNFENFGAFCVEPNQPIVYGETLVYDIQDPTTLANVETISRLIGGYIKSDKTALDAAAVQWAIWETTSELLPIHSLDTGNVRISSTASGDVATLANQYLNNVNSYSPATLTYLTNSTSQNIVTWNVVPEPGSAALLALSALLLICRRR